MAQAAPTPGRPGIPDRSATRDGSAATRDGSAATRDGSAATRDGSAATRDGSAATRDGSAATRDGSAATRDRPTTVGGRPGGPAGGASDVFGERAHTLTHWALPPALGLVYGYWAAAMDRDAGPITGWNLLFGFVTAFVFAALFLAVQTVAPRLRREPHALLWAAFAGCAFGFLYSQAPQHSVLRSAVMSAGIAAAVFAVAFYRYYTHEDAQGHRVG